jgi:hypothetical protein
MQKDKFDIWYETATPDMLEAAKQKAHDIGNAYIRKNLEKADSRMLKAILRFTWDKLTTKKIQATIESDDARKEYLAKLMQEPTGWDDHGSFMTKWDDVTKTVLRKQKPVYQERRWNYDDVPE